MCRSFHNQQNNVEHVVLLNVGGYIHMFVSRICFNIYPSRYLRSLYINLRPYFFLTLFKLPSKKTISQFWEEIEITSE